MAHIEKTIELEIESIGFEGIAIARKDNMVYFVQGGIPGDKVIAGLQKKQKNYTKAYIKEIISPSNERIAPVCQYFGSCGGCSWQALTYQEQLKWKRQHVVDAFERLGKIFGVEYFPTLPSAKEFNYRNKMEFSFGNQRWLTPAEINSGKELTKDFALGLHVPGRYDKIIDIETCHIQTEIGNKILDEVRTNAIRLGSRPYETKNHTGFLKSLLIRNSLAHNEVMVILVTGKTKCQEDNDFIEWFKNEFTKLNYCNEVIWAVNPNPNTVAMGDILFSSAKGYITEQILGIDYRISPFSFFQTNSSQLDRFISLIVEKAELSKDQIVWDLYCGTGSITLPASKSCKEIYGIELAESSIQDAKSNAKINNLNNVEFFCADLHSAKIPDLLFNLPNPDTIIIDPPRAGMNTNLIEHLLKIKAKRIVYVSCNPSTQARDIQLLSELYDAKSVYPVDMFPHTYHIESVAVLERK